MSDRVLLSMLHGRALYSRNNDLPFSQGVIMADSTSSASGSDSICNPMGTDGFEFVEYEAPDPQALGRIFE
jgi:hypothetical protein